MKTVKIPTDEKELRKFLENFIDYAKKRGIRVYSIMAYSPMVESAIGVYPDLIEMATRDSADCERFVNLWFDATGKFRNQMKFWIDREKGARK